MTALTDQLSSLIAYCADRVIGMMLCDKCHGIVASTARGFAPLDPLERISNQDRTCRLGSHCHGTNRRGSGVGV